MIPRIESGPEFTPGSGVRLAPRWSADRASVSTGHVVVLALVVVVATWSGDARVAVAMGAVPAASMVVWAGARVLAGRQGRCVPHSRRSSRVCVWWLGVGVALAVVAAVRADAAWVGLAPDRLGPFTGWATLVDDPRSFGSATRLTLEVEGERFEAWARRRSLRTRAEEWRAGEQVVVSGVREPMPADRVVRVASRHVVGVLVIDWAGDSAPGAPLAEASNRVRAAIERAAAHLPPDDGALFRGLVVGDDRDQRAAVVERFRRSGLSHLTAVSGQNVAFVLAAAGPLLASLRPLPRWAVTLGLIAWFVALTRVEPSILRAGTMAGLSATAFLIGAGRSPVRHLALAVVLLVFIDPLIVWSVGFWLSVGATLGVTAAGPWLSDRLALTGPLATPLGVTLGAQLGVVLPSVLVFGRLPLTSVPANLLAVPVAGAVMLYGLPAGVLAGLVEPLAPVLMAPVRVGTKWVDTVAALAARFEPPPHVALTGWVVLAVAGAVALAAARWRHRRPPAPPT